MPLFWGRKKQNVHEFCVFGRYLLRKSFDGSCFWAAFLKMGARLEKSPTIS